MKTIISKDLCISCELCPEIAPDLYTMDEDGKAVAIIEDELSDEEVDLAMEAVDNCPTGAIAAE